MLRKKDTCLGSIITEFAILLPLITVILGGTIDWSMACLASHVAQDVARSGARTAVTVSPSLYSIRQPLIESSLRAKLSDIKYITLVNSGVVVNPPTDITSEPTNQEMVNVEVSAEYKPFFLRIFGITSIPIEANSVMRYEWQN